MAAKKAAPKAKKKAAKKVAKKAAKKAEVETAIADLKKTLEGADFAAIKSGTEKLSTLSQELGAALYAANAAAGAEAPKNDGVEDAEVVED